MNGVLFSYFTILALAQISTEALRLLSNLAAITKQSLLRSSRAQLRASAPQGTCAPSLTLGRHSPSWKANNLKANPLSLAPTVVG